MGKIDSFKLTRNTATLEAYRKHQRAIRAAGQPWLTISLIALAAALLVDGLCLRAMYYHKNFFIFALVASVLMFASGLASAIGWIRGRLYSRAHPLELPETPPVFRPYRKSN